MRSIAGSTTTGSLEDREVGDSIRKTDPRKEVSFIYGYIGGSEKFFLFLIIEKIFKLSDYETFK